MRLLVPVLLALLGLAISGDRAFADGPWQGYWATTWQDGGAGLDLTQDGNRVTGTYPLHGGRVEAVATGSRLDGRWTEGNQSGGFVLFMGRDGNSFSGTYETGEWWTGARAAAFDEPTSIDFKNPREVFQQFVIHNNIARGGRPDHWGIALLTLDFGDAGATMERADKLRRMQDLFSVIDLTTFRTSSVPANPPYPPVKLRLEQAGTDAAMTLTMVKDEFGDWRIHVPSDEEVDADRRAFLAARGGQPPTADGYKRLQNPRDTMRSFLVGMSDWDGDGRALALSTLDLSGMPEGLRKGQGPITALYLRHVLNRIGLVGLQSIPNDGTDRTPYTHFSHPAGRIVIAPSGPEPGAPWKFTQRTVADADDLYREVDALPPQAFVPPDLIPDSTFFALRWFFGSYFPGSLGSLDRWNTGS